MSGDGPLILAVDDDADLLRLLTLRLQSAGYRVATADSGKAALAQLALVRPSAVITDLRMEGMEGMALFQRIHGTDPGLPVIVLTAHGSIPDAVQATQQGVFGYLTKPFDARELLQLLARAVALPTPATPMEADAAWRAGIISANPRMEALLSEARLAAGSEAGILIRGESGTGKEILAQAIHLSSPPQADEHWDHPRPTRHGRAKSQRRPGACNENAAGTVACRRQILPLPLRLSSTLLRPSHSGCPKTPFAPEPTRTGMATSRAASFPICNAPPPCSTWRMPMVTVAWTSRNASGYLEQRMEGIVMGSAKPAHPWSTRLLLLAALLNGAVLSLQARAKLQPGPSRLSERSTATVMARCHWKN